MKNAISFLLGICFVLALPSNSFPQDRFDFDSKGVYGSLKLMYNVGWSKYQYTGAEKESTMGRSGYGFGYEQIFAFSENVIFAVGAELNSRGYKHGSSDGTERMRAMYLDVPFTFSYISDDLQFLSYEDKVLVGVGGYYGYALMGKKRMNGDPWTNLSFGNGATDDFIRPDYGLVFNFGYRTSDLPFLLFSYQVGLNNVLSEGNPGVFDYRKMRCFKISLFLPFKYGKVE